MNCNVKIISISNYGVIHDLINDYTFSYKMINQVFQLKKLLNLLLTLFYLY